MRHVFRIHGFPQDMVSDRGPQFTSRFWKAFGRLIGSSISLSSSFHPQSNGQTERVNQEIEKTLRCLVADNQSTWSSHLIWAEFAHNTLYHSSIGMSPFVCQYGFPPPLFPGQESCWMVDVPGGCSSCHTAVPTVATFLAKSLCRLIEGCPTTAKADKPSPEGRTHASSWTKGMDLN